jgi:hypothetical protein
MCSSWLPGTHQLLHWQGLLMMVAWTWQQA